MRFDSATIHSLLSEIRQSMREQLTEFLKGTGEDNPHNCEIELNDDRNLPPYNVIRMFLYTECGNKLIVLNVTDYDDNLEFDDLRFDEQVKVLEYIEGK